MTEKWRQALDNGKVVGIVLWTFRKLLTVSTTSGVSGNLHEWIMDYLHNRKQYITISGESSDSMEVK